MILIKLDVLTIQLGKRQDSCLRHSTNHIIDARMRAYDVTALASLPLAAAILLYGSTGGGAVSTVKTKMAYRRRRFNSHKLINK